MSSIFLKNLFACFTCLGKTRLILICFQIVFFAAIANSIYSDNQSTFECTTLQPGCQTFCTGVFAALSPVRFWLLQLIITIVPTAVYFSCAIHKITRKDEEKPWTSGRLQAIRREGLLKVYVLQLVSRLVLEAGCLSGQYFLYGFEVSPLFKCSGSPCPHVIDCYVPRFTEKTNFLRITFAVSSLFLCLTLVELLDLVFKIFHQNKRLNLDKIQENSQGITSEKIHREGIRI